jgi:putative ABC transport system permease protein
MLAALNRIAAITAANLRTIPNRLGISMVIVIGIAGVVAVLTSLLAMNKGLSQTLQATGKQDRVIMLRAQSQAELNSVLDQDSVQLAKRMPGLAVDADGNPIASGELIVITELPQIGKGDGGVNVTLRGVEQMAFKLRPELRIIEGRAFTPGLRELIVGQQAQRQFSGLNVGSTARFRGSEWRVVGVFSSGDAHESELWSDLEIAQSSFGRFNSYQSMVAQLSSPDQFDVMKAALAADVRLKVDLQSERAYYSAQSEQSTLGIKVLTGVVGFFMALGAIFAALNTMYSAVSTRAKEIATLRAIGFGAMPVVISVMAESLLLALIGGIIGALLAYFMFNGNSVSTLGAGFTQVAFQFMVTPALIATGLLIALCLGFIGGFLPAMSAARTNIPQALRAG